MLVSTGMCTDTPHLVSSAVQTADMSSQTPHQPVQSTASTAVKLDERANEINASPEMRAGLSQYHAHGSHPPQVYTEVR